MLKYNRISKCTGLQDASRRVSQSASRVLHAVDWPLEAEASSRPADGEAGPSQQGSSTATQSSAARQLRTAWFAAQDQTERFWAVCPPCLSFKFVCLLVWDHTTSNVLPEPLKSYSPLSSASDHCGQAAARMAGQVMNECFQVVGNRLMPQTIASIWNR